VVSAKTRCGVCTYHIVISHRNTEKTASCLIYCGSKPESDRLFRNPTLPMDRPGRCKSNRGSPAVGANQDTLADFKSFAPSYSEFE
jgi:hypothetical protein